jgi:hypothetical protein
MGGSLLRPGLEDGGDDPDLTVGGVLGGVASPHASRLAAASHSSRPSIGRLCGGQPVRVGLVRQEDRDDLLATDHDLPVDGTGSSSALLLGRALAQLIAKLRMYAIAADSVTARPNLGRWAAEASPKYTPGIDSETTPVAMSGLSINRSASDFDHLGMAIPPGRTPFCSIHSA